MSKEISDINSDNSLSVRYPWSIHEIASKMALSSPLDEISKVSDDWKLFFVILKIASTSLSACSFARLIGLPWLTKNSTLNLIKLVMRFTFKLEKRDVSDMAYKVSWEADDSPIT